MIWDEVLAELKATRVAVERLANKWAPGDIRDPGPPFSNSLPPSPTLPPVITQPPPLTGNPSATIQGVPTDTLPFNLTSNTGSHVTVRNNARLKIEVPKGFVGRKQLEVSNVFPGQPDRVTIALNGINLEVPFAGGLAKMPSGLDPLFVDGMTFVLDVNVEPVGFGINLILR